MGLLSKIKDFLRGKKGIGGAIPAPIQEGHELKLEEKSTENEDIQTTFNTDNLNVLVEEGVIENVEIPNEN